MEQSTHIVHEAIDGTGGRYRWTQYLNIRVIEDTTNGYINATKMCAMYGKSKNGQTKQFRQWKCYHQQFIEFVSSSVGVPTHELVPTAVTGGSIEIIRGTYVHRDLAINLASWCSDAFGYKVSKIINCYIESENKLLLEKTNQLQHTIGELVLKANSAIELKDQTQVKLEKVMDTVTSIEEQVVVPVKNVKVKELMVLMYSEEQKFYVTLRTQECNKKRAIKNCKRHYGQDFEEAFEILAYQNPRNLFHRFKESVRGNSELQDAVTFHRTTFETQIDIETIKSLFISLEKTFQERVNTL